jgi:hypothetical protein
VSDSAIMINSLILINEKQNDFVVMATPECFVLIRRFRNFHTFSSK